MPYIKQTWVDEVPTSTPLKYKISQASDGDIATDAEIELVTPVSAGSPVNAGRLANMENGIETAQDTAETAIEDAALAHAAADAAQSTADNAIPKNIATAVGQFLYSTAAGVWAAFAKPSVDSVLKITSAGVFSWLSLQSLGIKSRQGGNSSNWSTGGGSNYSLLPTDYKIFVGINVITVNSGLVGSFYSGTKAITFPETFTYVPYVFCQTQDVSVTYPYAEIIRPRDLTTSGFNAEFVTPYNFTFPMTFAWMAIGK